MAEKRRKKLNIEKGDKILAKEENGRIKVAGEEPSGFSQLTSLFPEIGEEEDIEN